MLNLAKETRFIWCAALGCVSGANIRTWPKNVPISVKMFSCCSSLMSLYVSPLSSGLPLSFRGFCSGAAYNTWWLMYTDQLETALHSSCVIEVQQHDYTHKLQLLITENLSFRCCLEWMNDFKDTPTLSVQLWVSLRYWKLMTASDIWCGIHVCVLHTRQTFTLITVTF